MKFIALISFAFAISHCEATLPETVKIPNKVVLSGKQKRTVKRKLNR